MLRRATAEKQEPQFRVPPEHVLFGKSSRFQHVGNHCPSLQGYVGAATYENKVVGYLNRAQRRVGNIQQCWHGTSPNTLKGIAVESLIKGGGGLCGAGVYVSPHIWKAQLYMRSGSKPLNGFLVLLECLAARGTPYHAREANDQKHRVDGEHYHSVSAGGTMQGAWNGYIKNEEWVFYNPNLVTVQAVHLYREQEEAPTTIVKKRLKRAVLSTAHAKVNHLRGRDYAKQQKEFQQRMCEIRGVPWVDPDAPPPHPCTRNGVQCIGAEGDGCFLRDLFQVKPLTAERCHLYEAK